MKNIEFLDSSDPMRERPHSKSMCNCSSWSPLSYDSSEGTDKLLKQMSPTPATLASLPNIGAQLKKKKYNNYYY